ALVLAIRTKRKTSW
ncbi:hypothetical protein D046_3065B, partial [Vibrio parahaemolyticus V-223/04]